MNQLKSLLGYVTVFCIALGLIWMFMSSLTFPFLDVWWIMPAALIVGLIAWVLRYPADQINTLGDNKIVWGLIQTVLVVGFIVGFILAVYWVKNGSFLRDIGIDASPRIQWFMSILVVSLFLLPLPTLINWVIPTSGVFAGAVWRTLLATSVLLLIASIFSPHTALFDPVTGEAMAKIDADGNITYHKDREFSSVGKVMKPITPAQAKKLKPWWDSTVIKTLREPITKAGSDSLTAYTGPSCVSTHRTPLKFNGTALWGRLAINQKCDSVTFIHQRAEAKLDFEGGLRCPYRDISATSVPRPEFSVEDDIRVVQGGTTLTTATSLNNPREFNPSDPFETKGKGKLIVDCIYS